MEAPRRNRRRAPLTGCALSRFYGEMRRPLQRYLYRVTGSAADAEDIVQDVFFRLLRADVETLPTRDLRRYAFCVASHIVIDRQRRATSERRWRRLRARATAFVKPVEPRDDVTRTLDTLKPRERALLWLAYVEEHSHREIAGALGVGRGSVKVLLFRARAKLRDRLVAVNGHSGHRPRRASGRELTENQSC
jgi:RNA polymerase sigma factor (sigma-70 family)